MSPRCSAIAHDGSHLIVSAIALLVLLHCYWSRHAPGIVLLVLLHCIALSMMLRRRVAAPLSHDGIAVVAVLAVLQQYYSSTSSATVMFYWNIEGSSCEIKDPAEALGHPIVGLDGAVGGPCRTHLNAFSKMLITTDNFSVETRLWP